MSCDHLEMLGTNSAVVKSVDKNNNGKQFKITRSFIQKTAIPTITDETQLTCTAGLCMNALAGVDSVVLGGTCDAAHADDGGRYPIHRTVVSTSSNNAAGVGQALSAASTVTISTGAATDLGTGTTCSLKLLARHVITLDSAPTESLVAVLKNLFTHPQLGVAVLLKQPKVHTKVLNVPTVVHAMEKVVYVHVTKVIQANHAKHKQFWFKFAKKTSL